MSTQDELDLAFLEVAAQINNLKSEIEGLGGGGGSEFDVTDYGLLGWTINPAVCSTQQTLAGGRAYLTRMKIAVSGTLAKVYYKVTNAAASLTKARLQFYNTSGVLLGQTADLSSLLSPGDKTTNLETPFEVTAGEEIWAVFYCVGTTGPTITSSSIIVPFNFGLTTSSPLRIGSKAFITTDLTSITKTDFTAYANQIPLFMLSE